MFRAGRAVSRASRGRDVAADRPLRDAAERLLSRCVTLSPRNAAAWLEYGILLLKRDVATVDGMRAIGRAFELADRDPSQTPPQLVAGILSERARLMQAEVDRLRDLRDGSRLGAFVPACADLGLFCENYTHPGRFNALVRQARALVPHLQQRRDSLLVLYQRILAADSTRADVARSYARELALGSEWERLAGVGRRAALAAGQPGLLVVTALAEARLGHESAADSLLRLAIPAVSIRLRQWYDAPPSGADTIPDFWQRARPLWVTPFNELQLEHWVRVTYAWLAFGDDDAGVVGPETPMGDALVRYGWPASAVQVVRDPSRLLSSSRQYAADYFLSCNLVDLRGNASECEVGAASGIAREEGGGRWLIWTYDPDHPSLIFEVRPGARRHRYIRDAPAEEHAQLLRRASPLVFRSEAVPERLVLPVQVARFRGAARGVMSLAVFAGLGAPWSRPPQESLEVGLFLFRDAPGFTLVSETRLREPYGESRVGAYRLAAPMGRYWYSIEALARSVGAAAIARDSIGPLLMSPDSLVLSDLLIARSAQPPATREVRGWRDLSVDPLASLTFDPGGTVVAVWETYGLRPGADSVGAYQVALSLRGTDARPFPVRVLQRLGIARSQPDSSGLSWTSERRLAADGRVVDYVAIQLPESARGTFELTITVTEAGSGRVARRSRALTVTER